MRFDILRGTIYVGEIGPSDGSEPDPDEARDRRDDR